MTLYIHKEGQPKQVRTYQTKLIPTENRVVKPRHFENDDAFQEWSEQTSILLTSGCVLNNRVDSSIYSRHTGPKPVSDIPSQLRRVKT